MKKIFAKQPFEIENFYVSELRRVQKIQAMEQRTGQLARERQQAVSHIKSLAAELRQTLFGMPNYSIPA